MARSQQGRILRLQQHLPQRRLPYLDWPSWRTLRLPPFPFPLLPLLPLPPPGWVATGGEGGIKLQNSLFVTEGRKASPYAAREGVQCGPNKQGGGRRVTAGCVSCIMQELLVKQVRQSDGAWGSAAATC